MKKGRVVIVLRGRQAGKKGVIVKTSDKDSSSRNFNIAVVAGIERYPRRVKHGHTKKQVFHKTAVKPFVKTINHQHLFPTRYNFDVDLSTIKGMDQYSGDPAIRKNVRRRVRQVFETRHREGKNKWFFTKLKY